MQFLHCFCHFQSLTVSRESSRSTLNRVSAIEFLLNLCGMASNLDIFCSETGSCFTCISGVYMVKSDPNFMFDQSPSLTSTWQYSVIIIATYWQRKLHLYYMTLHLFLDVPIQGGWPATSNVIRKANALVEWWILQFRHETGNVVEGLGMLENSRHMCQK